MTSNSPQDNWPHAFVPHTAAPPAVVLLTYAKVVSPRAVTVMLSDGRTFSLPAEHANYAKAVEAVQRADSVETIIALMDTVNSLAASLKAVGNVSVTRDGVFWHGRAISLSVTERILTFQAEGHDVTYLMAFLDNLLQNPYRETVLSMYEFLEKNKVPITKDGHFYAYKKVRADYKDYHSGLFDNSVGQKPSVAGWEVDPDRNHECSKGLHVCAPQYLPSYYGNMGHVMVCKVNPKDVYAIPRDYNLAKMRCTTYEVVGELTDEQKAVIVFANNPTMDPGDEAEHIRWGGFYIERVREQEDETHECIECGGDEDYCDCGSQGDPGDENDNLDDVRL